MEIVRLSAAYFETLRGFIGGINDELTRERIRIETVHYLKRVRMLAPIDFDTSKIDICSVSYFNPYTRRILDDIYLNIFPLLHTKGELP